MKQPSVPSELFEWEVTVASRVSCNGLVLLFYIAIISISSMKQRRSFFPLLQVIQNEMFGGGYSMNSGRRMIIFD